MNFVANFINFIAVKTREGLAKLQRVKPGASLGHSVISGSIVVQ